MIKGAMARMARYAKHPPASPVGRSPVLRFHPASVQLPAHLQSDSTLQNSVSSGGVYCSSRFLPARLSMSIVACGERIQSRHSGLRHTWLAKSPSHLRGFASSTKDVDGSAASAVPSSAGSGLPPPSSAEGAASGGPPDSVTNVVESTRNAVNSLLESSREAAAKMFPAVDNWMDPSGGGIAELVVPATSAIGVSLVAWLLLPKVLRTLHSYFEAGPRARIFGQLPQERQPYELSMFIALDLPARFLASAVTFSYL